MAIIAVVVIGCLVFFRVEEVEVTGNRRYTAQEIVDITGVREGDNLFGVNKNEIYERILQGLPYVDSVNCRRSLPNRLIITVTESEATAFIRHEGSCWLMNSATKILERLPECDLAEITGVTALQPSAGTFLETGQETDAKAEDLASLMTALEAHGLIQGADYIDLSSGVRIEMGYENRLLVYFPYASDYDYDARAFRAAVDYLQPDEESVVDLTFEDGPHLYPIPDE